MMSNSNTNIVIESITDDNSFEAFQLASRIFVESSVLHVAVGISLDEYREYIFAAYDVVWRQGLSIAAKDINTGKIVGALVACDYCIRGPSPGVVPEPMKPVNALLQQLQQSYLKDRVVNLGECLLVDMAVVDPSFRAHGVYGKLRESVHEVGRQAGFERVVGELSSAATQHLCLNRFGHTLCGEIKFEHFKYNQQRPFASISEPDSIIVVEGALNHLG